MHSFLFFVKVRARRLAPRLALGFAAALLVSVLGVCAPASAQTTEAARPAEPGNVVLVVHGGAGSIEEVNMTADEEAAYRRQLSQALQAGHAILSGGGSSLDAVEAAITRLESSPLFNAGRGAVFTSAGMVEHDASIMEGKTHEAGAIAGTRHIEHPIEAARLVMEESRHVMLAREGAEEFALAQGMALVPNDTFYTNERRNRFLQSLIGAADVDESTRPEGAGEAERPDHLGTVGAVALDQTGTLAAGTSTGGMSNKRWGRIGDSPIIGAGTYADNASAAISATGWGEYFIRGAVAHEITALMRYGGASVQEAAHTVIKERLAALGDGRGTGGVIALDAEGNASMPFTTPGMFRGWITEDGDVVVRFYGEDVYGDVSAGE